MKKTLFTIAIATSAILLFSCGQTNTTAEAQNTGAAAPFTIDSAQLKEKGQMVPKAKAAEWVAYYKKVSSDTLNGFTFRTSDLLAALGVKGTPSTPHIRAYLGVDSATGARKLFFVGVEGANLDTIPKQAGKDVYFRTKSKTTGLADGEEFALDLNYPCPTLCPPPPDDITKLVKPASK